MLQTGCAGVTSDQANSTPTGPVASPEDFRVLSGNGWKGHLTYLDYSSGSRSQIPVEIQVDEPNGRSLSYSIKYPGETQYNSSEKTLDSVPWPIKKHATAKTKYRPYRQRNNSAQPEITRLHPITA